MQIPDIPIFQKSGLSSLGRTISRHGAGELLDMVELDAGAVALPQSVRMVAWKPRRVRKVHTQRLLWDICVC